MSPFIVNDIILSWIDFNVENRFRTAVPNRFAAVRFGILMYGGVRGKNCSHRGEAWAFARRGRQYLGSRLELGVRDCDTRSYIAKLPPLSQLLYGRHLCDPSASWEIVVWISSTAPRGRANSYRSGSETSEFTGLLKTKSSLSYRDYEPSISASRFALD